MWDVSQIICIIILTLLSIIDIRYRKVPQMLLIVGNLAAIWYQCITGDTSRWLLVLGAAVGLLFLIVSRVTQEEIGYGDSWGILILGIFLGVWGVLEVLLISFLLLIVAGVAYCLVGKKTRKIVFPFYPFLAVGYALTVFMENGGA